MAHNLPQQAPHTAGQVATRQIREQILDGGLAPGSLLNQNDLATSLGMSRIPVRDALRTLAGEGLVVFRAHSTATVAPLSIDDLQELYELRLAIEPAVCREALPMLSQADLELMEERLEQLESASGSEWLDLNRKFHEPLYLCSGKPRSIEIIDRIRRATDRYSRIYHRFDRARLQLEHRLIFEAASAGHPRRLEGLLAAHLSGGYETMLRYVAHHESFDKKTTHAVTEP